MASSSREPGLGQPAITGMERPVISHESLGARNSFSKAVTPEYHGLLIEDFADLTKEQIESVTPQALHDSLIGIDAEAPNAVFYRNPLTREGLWIAVSPTEHKHLAGNITTLGNRVMSSVMASRAPRRDFGPDREAAMRGGTKAVEDKMRKLEAYKTNLLQPQIAAVHWLQHSAEHPGKAWKDGLSVRMTMETVRGGVFKDMLTAMQEAERWSPEKVAGVEKVLDYRLFFDRTANAHIKNWKTMLKLADVYLGYKKALYGDKIADAKRFISKYEQ